MIFGGSCSFEPYPAKAVEEWEAGSFFGSAMEEKLHSN